MAAGRSSSTTLPDIGNAHRGDDDIDSNSADAGSSNGAPARRIRKRQKQTEGARLGAMQPGTKRKHTSPEPRGDID
jgi:hypothetical protein